MSDYPMLISNKLHSFRNFFMQRYKKTANRLRLAVPYNGRQSLLPQTVQRSIKADTVIFHISFVNQ